MIQSVRLTSVMLTRRGYGVLEALDGRTGLEIAISQLPDLILLDDIMPGLDGFEVCRVLRDNPLTKAIPIIMLSVNTSSEFKTQALALGVTDIIYPMYLYRELINYVKRVLET